MTNQPTPPPATTAPAPEPIDDSTQHPMRRAMLWIARAITWLLNAYILIVEIILLLGFLLLLGGANPSSSFVQWAYRNLDRAMKPFRGIFEPIEIGTTSGDVPAVVETSVLFAMIVYGIVLIVVQALMQWLNSRVTRLDREDEEYQRQQVADRRMAAMRQQSAAYANTATQPAAPPAAPAAPAAPTAPAQPPSTPPPPA
ncbi:hypothetical protein [Ilumatobacter sp.]|uniref:hypothetical protein n=1 Tax=Ilumatobacter sp. TaxID=1967498 RepID=UPI003AF9C49F